VRTATISRHHHPDPPAGRRDVRVSRATRQGRPWLTCLWGREREPCQAQPQVGDRSVVLRVKQPGQKVDVQHGRPATRGVDQSLSEGSPGDLPGLARSDRWPLPLLDRVLSSAGVRLAELSDAETDARPPAGLVGRPADTARPGPAEQPHAGQQPAKLPRVLLVDDSTSMRRVLRGLLEDAGIEVVGEATDGAEGVELAVALRPEVVLMDWRMPRLDGVQATARIRQRLPEVQVVMFSSLEGAGIGVAAREAGASAFVGKGASPDQLCAAVLAAAPPGS